MINDNKKFNDFEGYLKGIVDEKEKLSLAFSEKQKLKEFLKELNWDCLEVESQKQNGNSRCYEVRFNDDVLLKISETENGISESFNHLKTVARDILYEGDDSSFYCSIQMESLDNRIHMSGDGIPRYLRKLGLGSKIYRAILEKENFIFSNSQNLSEYAKMVWDSIRKDPLFYTFFTKYHAYCFASNKPPVEIIQILEEQFEHWDEEVLWDEDFVSQHLSLIQKSKIKHLLK